MKTGTSQSIKPMSASKTGVNAAKHTPQEAKREYTPSHIDQESSPKKTQVILKGKVFEQDQYRSYNVTREDLAGVLRKDLPLDEDFNLLPNVEMARYSEILDVSLWRVSRRTLIVSFSTKLDTQDLVGGLAQREIQSLVYRVAERRHRVVGDISCPTETFEYNAAMVDFATFVVSPTLDAALNKIDELLAFLVGPILRICDFAENQWQEPPWSDLAKKGTHGRRGETKSKKKSPRQGK